MEGGLDLMYFRMLFWVCSLAMVCSQDTGPTATVKIQSEHTTEPREGDSVTVDCEISSIELPDYVKLTKRSSLQDTQAFIVDENGLTALTDNRFAVSPLQVVNSMAALYSRNMTIDPVQQSDQGYYQCYVKRSNSVITSSAEIPLLVHHRNEFPVCFPDGPATVTIGSSLSCKTLSDTRILNVSDTGMPTATNDGWVTSPTHAGGSLGQELIKTVTESEHSKTFKCFSTSNVSVTALACTIGPLTVVSVSTTHKPLTTPTTVQPSTPKSQNCISYTAVVVISIVIHLITVILLFLCCQYDPRRWQQLRGMLGRSSTPRQGKDRHGNGPEVDYEVPSPEPTTATPSTTTSPPATVEHVYQNEIAGPTSSN